VQEAAVRRAVGKLMADSKKTKKELIEEVQVLRSRLEELERGKSTRKRAEEALRESEERYRSMFDSVSNAILLIDHDDLTIVAANRAAQEHLKMVEAELVGRACYEVTHHRCSPCEPPDHPCPVREMMETGRSVTLVHTHYERDGNPFWVEVSASPVKDDSGNIVQVVHVARDISERKRAEEALRVSEERYRTLYESSRDGIATANLKGFITECNQAYADMLGYSREELKKIRYQDITPSKWHSFNEKIFQEVMEHGHSEVFEKEYIRKDGTVFPVALHTWRIDDEDGNPAGIGSIIRDITERKKAENEKEKLLRVLNERIKELSSLYGLSRLLEKSDVSLEKIFQRIANLIPPAWQYPDITCARIFFEGREFKTDNFKRSKWKQSNDIKVHENKAGSIEVYYLKQKPEIDEGPFSKEERELLHAIAERLGRIIERKQAEQKIRKLNEELEQRVRERTAELTKAHKNLLHEIEERKRLGKTLRESEKLVAAGQTAARIAHEINNPLAGIKNSFLLIKNAIPQDHLHYQYVGRIDKEISRVTRIVRQTFDLYRPGQESPREFRLHDVISDIVALLKVSTEEREVNIEVDTSDDSIIVTLTEALFRQVLYNLMQNAIEASPPGETVKVSAAVSNEQLILKISDQGSGIGDDIRDRIFEPFFTSGRGGPASGLGLGLSICKDIVDAMEGSISFESENGGGTTFSVVIPLSNESEELKDG